MKLVREHINEGFTDESDPIKDMGIGLYQHRNFNTEKEFVNFMKIALPILFKGEKIHDPLRQPDDKFEILDNYIETYISYKGIPCSNLRCEIYHWNRHLGNSRTCWYINEAFTDESDPIGDMRVGANREPIYRCGECGVITTEHGDSVDPDEWERATAVINKYGDKYTKLTYCYSCEEEAMREQEREQERYEQERDAEIERYELERDEEERWRNERNY